MAILARRDGGLHGHGAMGSGIGPQGFPRRSHDIRRQAGRVDGIKKQIIGKVFWQGAREVDEIAVEVDVVFCNAPRPGKAMGIDGMDKDNGKISRQIIQGATA